MGIIYSENGAASWEMVETWWKVRPNNVPSAE